ncbi:MAG: hypothetical protein CMN93_06220, partial [Synechococcus sp. CPC35]|nr:hypothetical protein [Synechococcus sp. CPC35]
GKGLARAGTGLKQSHAGRERVSVGVKALRHGVILIRILLSSFNAATSIWKSGSSKAVPEHAKQ